mmetsp:Transcript_9212/g.10739  ORF Transcript_9212/g.10739 Transcript_9212/m.10739 type:complete len:165 (-) Transcript_9212:272-766(-)
MKNFASISITTAIYFTNGVASFSINHQIGSRLSTKLYLEDHIAEMIDTNHHRLFHKEALEQRRQENNSRVKEPVTPLDYEFTSDELSDNAVEMRRDQMLANKDPQKYCADRCVSTGHCDVFEDLFDFSAEEVMAFCTDCVLSEEDEPCDMPEGFLEKNMNVVKP